MVLGKSVCTAITYNGNKTFFGRVEGFRRGEYKKVVGGGLKMQIFTSHIWTKFGRGTQF